MSNSLDPDQARWNVGPILGPNCLQKLSADNSRRQKRKEIHVHTCTDHLFCFCNEGSDHTAQVPYLIHVYVLKARYSKQFHHIEFNHCQL